MNNNLNKEHSYLCLVTIYVIHVILFHVLYSPEVVTTNATKSSSSSSSSNFAAMTNNSEDVEPVSNRWKNSPINDRSENFSSLIFTGDDNRIRDDYGVVVELDDDVNGDNDTSLSFDYTANDTMKRIIGGVEATLGQFPHQVSLRRSSSGSHFCGGNIVDEEWIVTAAHCMYSNNELITASSITIYAGDLLLNTISSTSQIRRVRTIIIHEDFSLSTLVNDIALLKLRSKLSLNNVTVAAQEIRNETVEDGTLCQVSGWGVTQYGSSTSSNKLLYVNVPIINRSVCRKLMVNFSNIPEVMICAGYLEGGYDGCQGDSGGGLICDDLLTGLVSWGNKCGLADYPGIYTNVNVLKDWIINTIATNASSSMIGSKQLTPAVWGVFLGCIVFFFTSTDHET